MSDWTDDRIELLKTLWLEGATSTVIAQKMQISRSAALGKIRRLGLQRNALHDAQTEFASASGDMAIVIPGEPKAASEKPKAKAAPAERKQPKSEIRKPDLADKKPVPKPADAQSSDKKPAAAKKPPATGKSPVNGPAVESSLPWEDAPAPTSPPRSPASTVPPMTKQAAVPFNPPPAIPLPTDPAAIDPVVLANARHMPAGPGKGITIWELRDGLCKWPVGGLLEPPELFCGASTTPGSPWCPIHRTIAFTREPAREQQIKPPKR